MQTRISLQKTAPEAYSALIALTNYIATTTLEPKHRELIKIRASQVNGCAHCINMHTAEARKNGIDDQQIFLLSAWRDADIYSDAEKAILAFTEEVTLISGHVSDATYENLARHFDEKYISAILMMAIIINNWNRIAIATGLRVS